MEKEKLAEKMERYNDVVITTTAVLTAKKLAERIIAHYPNSDSVRKTVEAELNKVVEEL